MYLDSKSAEGAPQEEDGGWLGDWLAAAEEAEPTLLSLLQQAFSTLRAEADAQADAAAEARANAAADAKQEAAAAACERGAAGAESGTRRHLTRKAALLWSFPQWHQQAVAAP